MSQVSKALIRGVKWASIAVIVAWFLVLLHVAGLADRGLIVPQ